MLSLPRLSPSASVLWNEIVVSHERWMMGTKWLKIERWMFVVEATPLMARLRMMWRGTSPRDRKRVK